METIRKSIGEGHAKGELYAALAYDASDVFGGMAIKQIRFNPTPDTTAIIVGTSSSPITFTTACETKINVQIYSNYTGDSGYFRGLYSLAVYTPVTVGAGTASVYGLMGQVTMAAGTTHTEGTGERIVGVDGRFNNLGTLNGAGIWVAGTRGCLYGGGTWDRVLFAAGVLSVCQLTETVDNGVYAAFVAFGTNAPIPHAVLSIHGYFANFLNVENTATCYVAGNDEHTSTTRGLLKVMTGAGVGYINVYV